MGRLCRLGRIGRLAGGEWLAGTSVLRLAGWLSLTVWLSLAVRRWRSLTIRPSPSQALTYDLTPFSPDRDYLIAPRPRKTAAASLGGLPKNLGRGVGHAREPPGTHVNRCSQKSRILGFVLYPHHLCEKADFRKSLSRMVFLYSLLYFTKSREICKKGCACDYFLCATNLFRT